MTHYKLNHTNPRVIILNMSMYIDVKIDDMCPFVLLCKNGTPDIMKKDKASQKARFGPFVL